jgi:hypothetical protein
VASGANALFYNTTGYYNVANGGDALTFNTTGGNNVANGYNALHSNITGNSNVANGANALPLNTTGGNNVANGYNALSRNTTGLGNVANGDHALFSNTTGNYNTALGYGAGSELVSGSGNVYIGSQGADHTESNTTRIRNIYGSSAYERPVYVNGDEKIGTLSSSRRYKEEIKPMGQASETLFGLKPVTFRYKKDVDRSQALSFGLIAEEVAEISPDLITRDKEGKPETVRYEAVNAMLLNEFLKEHKKVEKLEATVVSLTATVKEQAVQIQKVSAQLEASKPAPRVVNSNQLNRGETQRNQ